MRHVVSASMPIKATIAAPRFRSAARLPASSATSNAREGYTPRAGRGYAFGDLALLASVSDRDSASEVSEASPPPADAKADAVAEPAGLAAELPAEGGSVALPDIIMPESPQQLDDDAVAGTLTYSSSVAQRGRVNPFGSTHWSDFNMTSIVVTPPPAARAPAAAPAGPAPRHFTVTATVSNPIRFNVTSGGRTDIASENSAAITHTNFARVARDLTPNMHSDGGRPPRRRFWAQDLTIVHEQFHVNERKGFAAAAVITAQAWLQRQTANSVAGVRALLRRVPARLVASSDRSANPGKEARAYGAGAPAYRARADAIKTKGRVGGYRPAAPGPHGHAPGPAPGPAPARRPPGPHAPSP